MGVPLYLMLAIFIASGCANGSQYKRESKCEPLTVKLCADMPYNMTIFPNMLGHKTQNEAAIVVQQFYPLVQVRCAPELSLLLCSLYAPVCTALEKPIPPCQKMCMRVQKGCEPIMKQYGFIWPEALNCARFPKSGLCVSANQEDSNKATTAIPTTTTEEPTTVTASPVNVTGEVYLRNCHCICEP